MKKAWRWLAGTAAALLAMNSVAVKPSAAAASDLSTPADLAPVVPTDAPAPEPPAPDAEPTENEAPSAEETPAPDAEPTENEAPSAEETSVPDAEPTESEAPSAGETSAPDVSEEPEAVQRQTSGYAAVAAGVKVWMDGETCIGRLADKTNIYLVELAQHGDYTYCEAWFETADTVGTDEFVKAYLYQRELRWLPEANAVALAQELSAAKAQEVAGVRLTTAALAALETETPDEPASSTDLPEPTKEPSKTTGKPAEPTETPEPAETEKPTGGLDSDEPTAPPQESKPEAPAELPENMQMPTDLPEADAGEAPPDAPDTEEPELPVEPDRPAEPDSDDGLIIEDMVEVTYLHMDGSVLCTCELNAGDVLEAELFLALPADVKWYVCAPDGTPLTDAPYSFGRPVRDCLWLRAYTQPPQPHADDQLPAPDPELDEIDPDFSQDAEEPDVSLSTPTDMPDEDVSTGTDLPSAEPPADIPTDVSTETDLPSVLPPADIPEDVTTPTDLPEDVSPSLKELLDEHCPDRSVDIEVSWPVTIPELGEDTENTGLALGDEVTLSAYVSGYSGLPGMTTTIFWEVDRGDGLGWQRIPEDGHPTVTVILDEENSTWQWRAGVTVRLYQED